MIWRYLICLFIPFSLFASSDGTNYDILERTANFLIFAFILWWLLRNVVKEAYNARIKNIADKLESVQSALKNTALKREEAKKKVLNAQDDVKSLKETSKKELKILIEKLQADVKNELENLEKSYNDKILMEKRRMKREVISEILDELFKSDAFTLDKKEFVNMILKKVA